ncbi:hypothetical protein HDE_14434 [Halotydeus destructor]|nr:hypothetical protein HDE_14434 [Halotydeus destructor]
MTSYGKESSSFRLTQFIGYDCLKATTILMTLLVGSSYGFYQTVVCLGLILPILAGLRNCIWPQLRLTYFYASWATISFAVLMITFQYFVVPNLEIYAGENAALCVLSIISLVSVGWIRNQSPSNLTSHSTNGTVGNEISPSYISYLKVTLIPKTRVVFIVGCLITIGALIYGAQLSLTTICHPALFQDAILIPDDCSDVYSDGVFSFIYVCSIYSIQMAFVIMLEMFSQLRYATCSKEVNFVELKASEC